LSNGYNRKNQKYNETLEMKQVSKNEKLVLKNRKEACRKTAEFKQWKYAKNIHCIKITKILYFF
jgi:hypothetical protein